MGKNPFGMPNKEALRLAKRDGHGMIWYYIIIWVQLIFGAFFLGYTAWSCFTGQTYVGTEFDLAVWYATYPALRFLDVGTAVVCVALVASMPLIRLELINFRQYAPVWFLSFNILYSLIGLLYTPVQLAIIGSLSVETFVALGPATWGPSIIGGLIPIIANVIYFKKRNYLFVN